MTTFYVLVLIGGTYGATPATFPERFTSQAACKVVGERWARPIDYNFEHTRIEPTFRCIKMKKAAN